MFRFKILIIELIKHIFLPIVFYNIDFQNHVMLHILKSHCLKYEFHK